MIPTNRTLPHPGEILKREFLDPMQISQTALAERLDIQIQRVNEIVNGRRGISPQTALLLGQAFGTSPEFWMNLQTQHDLSKAKVRSVRRFSAAG